MDKICPFFWGDFNGECEFLCLKGKLVCGTSGAPLEVAREGHRKRVARFHKPLLVSVANQKERNFLSVFIVKEVRAFFLFLRFQKNFSRAIFKINLKITNHSKIIINLMRGGGDFTYISTIPLSLHNFVIKNRMFQK